MNQVPIIEPVQTALLKAELTEEHFLRETNHSGNKLYVVDNQCAPNVLREIGRLREIAFRAGGGGTGKEADLDAFDLDAAFCYKQLVLWDPEEECIVGGYRFVPCDEVLYDRFGQPLMPSSHLFHFTKHFLGGDFLHTIELSRSFIRPEYQSTELGSKSLYALDNLFDGIGAISVLYKKTIKYFFGKATIYREYPTEAREMIMVFMKKYFGEGHKLIHIRKEVKVEHPGRYSKLFKGLEYKEAYKVLKGEIQRMGAFIPPLVNTYMNLSPSMIFFGTGINDEFGDIYDSGILINFQEMYPEKKKRHVETFSALGWRTIKQLFKRFNLREPTF
jgi:hypothetical protein